MASPATVLHPPSKQQIAHAIAGALPSELSESPLVGILGVVLGAGIVTLTGRMLTLGTSDLKGSLGIDFDEGAWIGSACFAGNAVSSSATTGNFNGVVISDSPTNFAPGQLTALDSYDGRAWSQSAGSLSRS